MVRKESIVVGLAQRSKRNSREFGIGRTKHRSTSTRRLGLERDILVWPYGRLDSQGEERRAQSTYHTKKLESTPISRVTGGRCGWESPHARHACINPRCKTHGRARLRVSGSFRARGRRHSRSSSKCNLPQISYSVRASRVLPSPVY